MEYSQIILEMLERIKILESKVQSLEEQNNMKSTDNSTQMEKRQLEKQKMNAKVKAIIEKHEADLGSLPGEKDNFENNKVLYRHVASQ